MHCGHIWPAAAPGHCHVVEVKGLSLEKQQRQRALRETATSIPFITAPLTAGKREMEA